jgi:hypothetical protein
MFGVPGALILAQLVCKPVPPSADSLQRPISSRLHLSQKAGLVSRKGLYTEERQNKKDKEQKRARPPKRIRKKCLPKAAHQKKLPQLKDSPMPWSASRGGVWHQIIEPHPRLNIGWARKSTPGLKPCPT